VIGGKETYYSYVLFLAGRDDAVGKKIVTTEKSINEADISRDATS
jgi:hypothetical protein